MNVLQQLYQQLLAQGYPPDQIPAVIRMIAAQNGNTGTISTGQQQVDNQFRADQLAADLNLARAQIGQGQQNYQMQLAQMQRQAEQDPFRLGEYLADIANHPGSGANPVQQLLGAGVSIKPQLPYALNDPTYQNMNQQLMKFGTPSPPQAANPDPGTSGPQQSDLDRMNQAFRDNPQAAATFFSQDPANLQRMFGAHAAGGNQTLNEPTLGIGLQTGMPRFLAGEAGKERVTFTPLAKGGTLRFKPPRTGLSPAVDKGRLETVGRLMRGTAPAPMPFGMPKFGNGGAMDVAPDRNIVDLAHAVRGTSGNAMHPHTILDYARLARAGASPTQLGYLNNNDPYTRQQRGGTPVFGPPPPMGPPASGKPTSLMPSAPLGTPVFGPPPKMGSPTTTQPTSLGGFGVSRFGSGGVLDMLPRYGSGGSFRSYADGGSAQFDPTVQQTYNVPVTGADGRQHAIQVAGGQGNYAGAQTAAQGSQSLADYAARNGGRVFNPAQPGQAPQFGEMSPLMANGGQAWDTAINNARIGFGGGNQWDAGTNTGMSGSIFNQPSGQQTQQQTGNNPAQGGAAQTGQTVSPAQASAMVVGRALQSNPLAPASLVQKLLAGQPPAPGDITPQLQATLDPNILNSLYSVAQQFGMPTASFQSGMKQYAISGFQPWSTTR